MIYICEHISCKRVVREICYLLGLQTPTCRVSATVMSSYRRHRAELQTPSCRVFSRRGHLPSPPLTLWPTDRRVYSSAAFCIQIF